LQGQKALANNNVRSYARWWSNISQLQSASPTFLSQRQAAKQSSAAGSGYQLTGSTWKNVSGELGLKSFLSRKPRLRSTLSRQTEFTTTKTGGDLDEELKRNGMSDKVMFCALEIHGLV
jgi:hypothetical protein